MFLIDTPTEVLALGATLSAFMAAFDITLARPLMPRTWPQVWADFTPAATTSASGWRGWWPCPGW